jgi:toxin HigB-1
MPVMEKFVAGKDGSARNTWGVRGCRIGYETFDNCNVTRYICDMIKTFADRDTKELYINGNSRVFPSDIVRRVLRKLAYLDSAQCIEDLRVPPGNRLHQLAGNRLGQHAISVNDQWRICFRFMDGDAYDVEITDYH